MRERFAYTLGCSHHEIAHLERFRRDHDEIAARLDEGVGGLAPHRPGAMSAQV